MITNEDHLILRRLLTVAAQAAYHKADRADAHTMRQCARGLRCSCGALRSAVTFDCVYGTHCPVRS